MNRADFIIRRAAVGAIKAYKVLLSQLFAGSCRFVPSCSAYASEAIERHGLWRGGFLALRRLARCQPLGSHGYDPVPWEKIVPAQSTRRQPRS